MQIDPKEFRNALGKYATGVTVISTFVFDKGAIAMTVNSFSSLSLDPPLILWSIDLESTHFDVFNEAENFAVNILTDKQLSISNTFANAENDQDFDEYGFEVGELGSPVLPNASAFFECEVFKRVGGGDHQLIIGKVLNFHTNDEEAPLIFSQGGYHGLGEAL